MKLYYMKEDAIAYLKENLNVNKELYLNSDNSWIDEKYKQIYKDSDSAFCEFKYEVDDISLDMSNEEPSRTDVENTKILYTALKRLNPTQAADARFWIGLAHSNFWQYMQYRCKIEKVDGEKLEKKILNNYFFKAGNKRSLIIHPLARLWWVGKLTYDENRKDPFEALEYLKVDYPTKVLTFFSSNFANNPQIGRSVLKAIGDIEKLGYKVKRDEFLELLRYINILSGVTLLDYLSEEELKCKIIKHYKRVN